MNESTELVILRNWLRSIDGQNTDGVVRGAVIAEIARLTNAK